MVRVPVIPLPVDSYDALRDSPIDPDSGTLSPSVKGESGDTGRGIALKYYSNI